MLPDTEDATAPAVTIDQMIQCAQREVGMRERVYPNRVAERKMSQQVADRELDRMKAIVDTLALHQQIVALATEEGRDPVYKIAAIEQLLKGRKV
jgi:hypothetical protein